MFCEQQFTVFVQRRWLLYT